MCRYDPTITPEREVLAGAYTALCAVASSQPQLQTNWHRKCQEAEAAASASANSTGVVDEFWTGVYFLEHYIGLHAHAIGMTGEKSSP